MRLSSLYSRKCPPDYSFMTDYVLAYAWLTVALDKGPVPTQLWLDMK